MVDGIVGVNCLIDYVGYRVLEVGFSGAMLIHVGLATWNTESNP